MDMKAKQMNSMPERMARLEEKVDNIDQKLDALIKGLDGRYASKWVERLIWGILMAFVVGGVYILLGVHR